MNDKNLRAALVHGALLALALVLPLTACGPAALDSKKTREAS